MPNPWTHKVKMSSSEISGVETDPGVLPQVHRHVKKTDWGRAIMLWEKPTKRAYQFEDGQVRLFKKGYYHLLSPVEMDEEEQRRLVNVLKRTAERRGERLRTPSRLKTKSGSKKRKKKSNLTMGDQVMFFRTEYPQGFDDSAWKSGIRGEDANTRRKGHRGAVLQDAETSLTEDKDHRELFDAFADLADRTDLVGPSRTRRLKALSDDDKELLGRLLHDLLWGDDTEDIRMERWIDGLGRTDKQLACWALATVPLAITDPETHLYVRRTVLLRQARVLGRRVPKKPSAPAYRRLLGMIREVEDKLDKDHLEPTDRLDVYDFIRTTLRPKAQELIKSRKGKS